MANLKVEKQIELEKLFAKNQLIPRLREYFEEYPDMDFKAYFDALGLNHRFGFTLLIQMALHKRCDITTLVGVLRKSYDDIDDVVIAIQVAVANYLVEYDFDKRQFIVIYDISDEVQQELDLYQYPVPMLVEPKELVDNNSFGYLTFGGSIILRDNHHNRDVNLPTLNKLNKTKLSINHVTAYMVNNTWKALDKQKEDETFDDYRKRLRAFDKYDRDSKNVMELIGDEEFYCTHRVDMRGRIYCQGYHVNYQGNDWNKAVVEMAEKEIVEID